MMRKKRSFGLLDAFIVTVILLSAVGLVLRIQLLRIDVREDETCTVRLLADNVPQEIAACLRAGDVLYTADGEIYGTVEGIESAPARVEWFSNGVLHTGEWEAGKRVAITLHVSVFGTVSDGVFLRGGKHAVLSGDTVALYSDLASLEWLICETEHS